MNIQGVPGTILHTSGKRLPRFNYMEIPKHTYVTRWTFTEMMMMLIIMVIISFKEQELLNIRSLPNTC